MRVRWWSCINLLSFFSTNNVDALFWVGGMGFITLPTTFYLLFYHFLTFGYASALKYFYNYKLDWDTKMILDRGTCVFYLTKVNERVTHHQWHHKSLFCAAADWFCLVKLLSPSLPPSSPSSLLSLPRKPFSLSTSSPSWTLLSLPCEPLSRKQNP